VAYDINRDLTLSAMLRIGIKAKSFCTHCDASRVLDIPALIERTSPDFRLFNKRTRCRMTEGCQGWNRFWCNRGAVFLPMWDDDTAEAWLSRGL